jgi:hypothetical protein
MIITASMVAVAFSATPEMHSSPSCLDPVAPHEGDLNRLSPFDLRGRRLTHAAEGIDARSG